MSVVQWPGRWWSRAGVVVAVVAAAMVGAGAAIAIAAVTGPQSEPPRCRADQIGS